ncbi:MAG: M48 family metallopeptidase, partial [Betaproteobacteria bacterium]|nr:M48 family metallopeptidase [Betaproteobacteria bacterium]
MDFFQHQELARRNTRVLVLLYALAVAAVVAAVTAVLAGAYLYSIAGERHEPVALADVPPGLWWGGALGTLAAILAVTVIRTLRLGGGGEAVARMAGAQEVSPETRDPLERRLLNVVEEMAIAAGARVPKVFVMAGEGGINAFAAGTEVSNAVVAVTRGTLETLNRDELQGVIGHEFSHILHGDMRLNLRMLGVLAGIVFIGAIGEFAMRSAGRAGGRREGAAVVVAAGIALFVIGYLGLFFARLIKSAVARQREFLADASSVQYTRNPEGIAGALDQIRASARGTLIANRYAEDMSHMYFGESVKEGLASLFATHPPIDERIRRVHPGFVQARYRAGRAPAARPAEGDAQRHRAAEGLLAAAVLATRNQRADDSLHAWRRTPQASAALVGGVDGEKVDYARRLVDSLPRDLRESLAHAEGARAAVLALLGPQPPVGLGHALHLPVIDLALPALKRLDAPARAQLLAAVEAAIRADRRVSLHEFVVQALLRSQLAPAARGGAGRAALGERRAEAFTLLSLIAHASGNDAAGAFRAGARQLDLGAGELAPRGALSLERVQAALEALRALAPLAKARLAQSLFAAATADGTIRLGEAELLRLVGAV